MLYRGECIYQTLKMENKLINSIIPKICTNVACNRDSLLVHGYYSTSNLVFRKYLIKI